MFDWWRARELDMIERKHMGNSKYKKKIEEFLFFLHEYLAKESGKKNNNANNKRNSSKISLNWTHRVEYKISCYIYYRTQVLN